MLPPVMVRNAGDDQPPFFLSRDAQNAAATLPAHDDAAFDQRREHGDALGLLHDRTRDRLVGGRHDFVEHRGGVGHPLRFVRGRLRNQQRCRGEQENSERRLSS